MTTKVSGNQFIIEQLEQRLLFSADFEPVALDGGLSDENILIGSSVEEIPLLPAAAESRSIDGEEGLRREILFIDKSIPDYEQLVDDLLKKNSDGRQVEVVLLDIGRNGIIQISETLGRYQDLDAVHVVSHGSDGTIQLGNSRLTQESLDSYADSIEGWGSALNGNADLLFYGCNLAAGEEGRELMQSLTFLTGADVAASNDITGNALMGGDWSLEYKVGSIESKIAVSPKLQKIWQVLLATSPIDESTHQAAATDDPQHAAALESYGNLPLSFIENRGQLDSEVLYYAQLSNQTVYFTRDRIVFDLTRQEHSEGNGGSPENPELTSPDPSTPSERLVFNLTAENTNEDVQVIGVDKLDAEVNYFVGSDASNWQANLSTYGELLYQDFYDGIDLRVYSVNRAIKYDFIVKPGGDPKNVSLAYQGIEGLQLDDNGELIIQTAFGEMKQSRPYVYQEINGERVEIASRFILPTQGAAEGSTFQYGFEIDPYDQAYSLTIDPTLYYSTYLGGLANETAESIAVDSSGNAYVAGYTNSSDFPTQNPYQGSNAGSYDAIVSKFDSSGNLVYSTYLGGSSGDYALGIAVDSSGNAYVAGYTGSNNFPTLNAYQGTKSSFNDVFVTKLNSAGSALVYSTYLGGAREDYAFGIAEEGGNAYVSGHTSSSNFPTQNPFQGTLGANNKFDAFVTKFSTDGTSIVYSTYVGGTNNDYGHAIAVESGNAYITGYATSTNFPTQNPYQTDQGGNDVFVTKVSTDGSALDYSTYLGGAGTEVAYGIAVDGSGNAYVTGGTNSDDFPAPGSPYQGGRAGDYDAFVTKFDPAGNTLSYSTYLGGSGYDYGIAVAEDSGNAYVTGYTASNNFPTQNPYQGSLGGGTYDAFVSKMSTDGTAISYSTYMGGSGDDYGYSIDVDGSGIAYVTGITGSGNFPTQSPYQASNGGGDDSFVFKYLGEDATTTIGDGTAPSNKTTPVNSTNKAVSSFTLSTDSGTDTLTALTVTLSGTGADADVSSGGVKLWRDDGSTANEWDSSDTQIGSGVSFSSGTASFSSLSESINTVSTQYLVTYDIDSTATKSITLLGAVTSVTVTNSLTNNDTADATLTVDGALVINTNDTGAGSLRQCITYANSNPGTTISFDIPASDGGYQPDPGDGNRWWRISPTSQLPDITASGTIIDATTQTTNQGNTNALGPEIELDGSLAGDSYGFVILDSANNEIRGFIVNGFAPANSKAGIIITQSLSTGNVIAGNYIGTDYSGTVADANDTGVAIILGADSNTIGGTTAADRNVISGNTNDGVYIGAGGFVTTSNVVQGNFIGTDVSGTADLGNGFYGVQINDNATGNTIGGTTAAERNIISGNDTYGVVLSFGANNNIVKGNYIGTDVNGTAAVANPYGIIIGDADGSQIGGTTAGERNVISGNDIYGVTMYNGSDNTTITGNYIGTQGDGVTALGNGAAGVVILGNSAPVTGTVVGGTGAGEGNVIAFNNGDGVAVSIGDTTGTTNNKISGNSIFENTGLGINLGGGGANGDKAAPVIYAMTPSGSDFIVTTGVTAGDTVEFYRANNAAAPAVSTDSSGYGEGYLYLGSITDGGGASSGPYISGTDVAADGTVTITLTAAGLSASDIITATVTDGVNGTSGFGFNMTAPTTSTIQVTTTADSGAGSLREAINYANSNPGADTIVFNIATAANASSGGDSWWKISPTSALPVITDSDTTIDATTQTTNQGDTNSLGYEIEIDGSGAGIADGFVIASNNNTIKGFIINGFNGALKAGVIVSGDSNTITGNYIGTDYQGTAAGVTANTRGVVITTGGESNIIGGTTSADRNIISNNGYGVIIQGSGTTLNTVKGNYIGTDSTGTGAVANTLAGVLIELGAQSNTIGGTNAEDRNIISGNTNQGITIQNANTSSNKIIGNYIGTDVNGTADLGNEMYGIAISDNATSNIIGGATAGERNVISGNDSYGILIYYGANNNVVKGNYIGTQVDGISNQGNGNVGILIASSASGSVSGNIIGGTASGEGNIIAYNDIAGVYVFVDTNSADANKISGNSIFENNGTGITLSAGANNDKVAPTITSVIKSGTDYIVSGTVGSGDTVEIFRANNTAAPAVTPDGPGGEGFLYIVPASALVEGGVNDSDPDPGEFTFTITGASLTAGDTLSSTATDGSGNTSQFSANAPIPDTISGTVYTDEGTTTIADGTTVRLLVNGTSVGTATTSGGAYEIGAVNLNPGDAILVYVDNNDGTANDGTTVTVSDGTNLSGLDIYVDHLITRHDNAGSLTNALMNTAKGAYPDSEILYSISAGDLTVSGAGTELYIASGHTFTPGGNIDTTDVKIEGTWTATGSESYSVSGSWENGGTFDDATSTVTFNATTAGNTITSSGSDFYNVVFNGSGGEWTLQDNFRQNSSGTTAFDNGELIFNGFDYQAIKGQTVTLGNGFTLTAGSGRLVNNGNTHLNVGTGSTITISTGYLGVNNLTVSGSGTFTCTGPSEINAAGNVNITSANWTPGASTLYQIYLTKTLNSTQPLYNYQVGMSGLSYDADITLQNNIIIQNNFTIEAGTGGTKSFNAAGYTMNVGGNWDSSGGTFTHGNNTVIFDGGNQTISGSTAFNNFTKVESTNDSTDVTLTFDNTATQTIVGTLTLNGLDADDRINLVSDSPTNQWSINLTASATKGTMDYLDVTDSDASVSDASHKPINPVNSIDNSNNVDWFDDVISGTVYTDEGVTPIADGATVRLIVNGVDAGTDTTVGGAYSITSGLTINPGDSILVYIDNDDGSANDGTTVTVSDGSDLAGLDIYVDHLITRHDNAGSLTNALMDTAKGAYVDTEILFSVDGSDNLTVSGSSTELYVLGGHSYTPGANITTPNMESLGTFNGGTGTIDINGNLVIGGGNYTATSGNTNIYDDLTISGGVFAHNSGTFIFDNTSNSQTVNSGAAILNDVSISKSGSTNLTVTGTMDVDGDLTISNVNQISTGTIAVAGNVLSTDSNVQGTGTILFDGAGAQLLSASGGTGSLASIDINKSGGTLTIQDTFNVTRNWTYTAGTVDASTSTIIFSSTGVSQTVNSGTMVFNDVTISKASVSITINGTMDVDGNLTISSVNNINTGTIAVAGNVLTTDANVLGSGTILFDGTGAQLLSAGGGTGSVPRVDINKSGGTLTIQDTINVTGHWTYTAGTVDASTSTIGFTHTGWSQTVDSGSMAFNDVTISKAGVNLTITGTMDINGDLVISSVNNMSSGTIALAGNLTSLDAAVNNTTSITLDGTGTQNIDTSGGDLPDGVFTIDKAGGSAVLISAMTTALDGGSQDLTIAQGTLDLNGFNLTVPDVLTLDANGTLQLEGGETVTATTTTLNAGSTVLYDGAGAYTGLEMGNAYSNLTFNGTGSWNLNAPLDVNGNITITSGTLDVDNIGNYQINVAGDWSNSGTFTARAGTVVFDGGDQAINGSTTFNNFTKVESSNDATDVTLIFDNTGTQTITGTLTMDGLDADDRINLISDSPTNQWSINLTASAAKGTMDYLDVTDSDASGSDASHKPINPANSNDGSNNIDWYPVNTPSTIGGTVAGQAVNDNATISPFSGVIIGDVDNPAQTLSVSVTLDVAAKGTFTTLNGFTDAGGGVYTFSGTAAAATTAIQGMVFDPTDNRVAPTLTETTTFTISVDDGSGPVTDNTTTVISTSINDVSTIGGTVAGQAVNDNATISPFSGVTIGDVDNPAQTLNVSVTLDVAAKGTFTTLNGFTDAGGGVYTFSGTAAAATTAIKGMVFDPTDNRVAPTLTETTTFTISVDDGNGPVIDNTTTVISTSINDVPTIGGTVADQAVNDNATVSPFSGVTLGDVDNPAQTLTVSVTLDVAAKGTFTTLNGFTDAGGGVYTFSGTAAAATTAIQGMVFDPTNNRVAPTLTETSTFTISVDDGSGPVTDNTTTVISTSVNDIPAIGGTVAGQTVNDNATISPFSGVTIGDVDNPAQTLTVSVTLDVAAKGTFTTLNGFTDAGGGVYTFSGTAAAATAAIQGMVFDPADNRVAPTLTETSTFTISVDDGSGPVTDNTTTVISTSINDVSTIGGTVAGQAVNDNATVSPFSGVTIGDVDSPAQTLTVSVTLDDVNKGTFTTLNGFTDTGGGVYTFSGTAAAATTAIQGMVFDPTNNRVAATLTETTTFTISVDDGSGPVTDNTTTVISTSVNDIPTIGGTVAGQAVNDNATISPFSGVTIGDVDNPAQTLTVSVTLDVAAKGIFTTLNGFTDAGGGVYTFSGTAAAATTAIQGMVFDPSDNRVAPTLTETTTFTISVDDGSGPVADNSTTVISTSINDAPTIGGTVAGQAVNDNATISPFGGVTTGDVDNPAQTLNVSVTLDVAAKGTFTTLNGFIDAGGGVYTFSGTAVAATAAIQGMVFDPTDNRVAPTLTETTTFTISVDDGSGPVTDNATTVISTSVNDIPTIGGTVAGQVVNDNATFSPFSGVTIGDVDNPSQTLNVSVTLDTAAKGTFTTLNGFTDAGGGVYTFSGTAAAATTAIQGMVFDPADNRVAPTLTETTTFTISVDDGSGPVTDNTTTIISTSINDIPTIGGTVAGQGVNDNATISPFSGVTIGDVDNPAQTLNVSVTLDVAAKGTFTTLNGFADAGGGVYTFNGTAAAATTAIQGMVFDPADNRVAPTLTETTTFTISVDDGSGPVTDNTTTVISTSINDVSTIGGTVAGQAVNDNATISPFSGVTIGDVDPQSVTVTVTLDDANKGAFTTLNGFTDAGGGVYTFSGTAAAATAAIQGMVYDPADNRVAPTLTEATTFTISVDDGSGLVTDSTTTVISTSINDAPTIGGTLAGQAVNDNATISPFSGVTIGDVDNPAQTLTVSVTLDAVVKGTFTTLNGFTDAGGGVYTFSGTASAATAANQGMVFDPADNRVAPTLTETTTFTISVDDGSGPVTDNTTTVISTSMNESPSAISLDNLTVDENASGAVIGNLATADPDSSDTHSYTVDDARFEIVAGQLKLRAGRSLDFEAEPTVNITVTSTDSRMLSTIQVFTIAVNDLNEAPNATNINTPEIYVVNTPLNLTDIIVSDVDSSNVTVTLKLTDTTAGTLSTATSGAVTSTFANGVWTASGAIADVNTLLAGLTFTPTFDYMSNFTIDVRVDDGAAQPITGVKKVTIYSPGTQTGDPPPEDEPTSEDPERDVIDREDEAHNDEMDEDLFIDNDLVVSPASSLIKSVGEKPAHNRPASLADSTKAYKNTKDSGFRSRERYNMDYNRTFTLSGLINDVVEEFSDIAYSINTSIEIVHDSIESMERNENIVTKTVLGGTLTLSVGLATWVFRGGSLVASALSTMPIWKGFDPLHVLPLTGRERREKIKENRKIEEEEKRKNKKVTDLLDAGVRGNFTNGKGADKS